VNEKNLEKKSGEKNLEKKIWRKKKEKIAKSVNAQNQGVNGEIRLR
jgi:hypothetical protein